MTFQSPREHRFAGAALLLVLLAVAALATVAAAVPAAADAPDRIRSAVLAQAGSGGDAVLSTPLAERVRAGDPVMTLGMAGPAARVYVYVELVPGTPTSVLDPVLSGIVDRDEERGLVTARATIDELEALAISRGVRQVREVDGPVVGAGRVMSAGDAVMQSDTLRAQGLTGAGVKVGVISDGVDGLSAAQASGDLGEIRVLSDEQGGTEGTAMLEIVHDVAPGAELYFHDHGDSVLAFDRAVDELVASGCTVIVDDVAWPREPFFEDGVIATHLDGLVSSGRLVYLSAAGNYARQHYQGAFADDGEGFHDFSASGSDRPFLYAEVPSGEQLRVVMQWDEPFGSSGDDFDLYLCDAVEGDVLRTSTNRQTGASDPLESLTWSNTGPDREVAIVALHRGGTGGARVLEVYAYPSTGAEVEAANLVAADSIYGHQAAAGVVAVGAVSVTSPGQIEPFSSNGPVTHDFPAPAVVQKPDLVAPDRVAVSGAGGFKPVFVGTSAAAPHVAGLCALVWSARPGLSGEAVRAALFSSAVDLGAAGRDTVYGWGRADGPAMLAQLGTSGPSPTAAVTTPPATPSPTPTPAGVPTRTPFGKRYAIGDLKGRSVGTGATVAPGPGPGGSPTVAPTVDPLRPPGTRFIRWYPAARWAAGL